MEIALQKVFETTSALSALKYTEVVLKTTQLERLRDWYVAALGVKPSLERTPSKDQKRDESQAQYIRASEMRVCFIQLTADFPYRQVLGIFEVPNLIRSDAGAPGMHHMQLRTPNLTELMTRYEALKAGGVRPFRTANHGTGTSFYYHDPDGNTVEFSASNFKTKEDVTAYRNSAAFKNNPSGIELDMEEFESRYKAGVAHDELVRIEK